MTESELKLMYFTMLERRIHFNVYNIVSPNVRAQLTGVAEYTDSVSAEG